MNPLYSLQRSYSEVYLRSSFQPSTDRLGNQFALSRVIALSMNSAWTLQSIVFQVALAVESSVKLIFSLLSLNFSSSYTHGLRLISVPINLTLTAISTLTIALSVIFPHFSLQTHQYIIGLTQITSAWGYLQSLEKINPFFSSQSKKNFDLVNKAIAYDFLTLSNAYPKVEDVYLLVRSVDHYWESLPYLLKYTESLDEESYHKLKQKALLELN